MQLKVFLESEGVSTMELARNYLFSMRGSPPKCTGQEEYLFWLDTVYHSTDGIAEKSSRVGLDSPNCRRTELGLKKAFSLGLSHGASDTI